ncbi:BnaC08g41230D [Brassica napus]|uniref:BnaC08g41230D protein n=1 Tax=Brassica napus TaxID=3708 RepID=A0A078FNJ1_BRANA|nr:BnaC08g41230D [Brassica napus]
MLCRRLVLVSRIPLSPVSSSSYGHGFQ